MKIRKRLDKTPEKKVKKKKNDEKTTENKNQS